MSFLRFRPSRFPGSRRTRLAPRVAALLAAASLGFAAGCGKDSGAPTEPTPSSSVVYYTAIGASDAAGVGASVPCVPFTECPDGTGYVQSLARQLKAGASAFTLMNLGIPAAVLSPRVQSIGAQWAWSTPANFIDQEAPFVPRDSTIITIFGGANDSNIISTAADRGAGGGDVAGWVGQQIAAFGTDYAALLKAIRARAPSARIVVANLPNFAGAPFTAGYSSTQRSLIQRVSVGFSTEVINPLAGQGIAVVDLLCDPRMYERSTYSPDGFHPNDSGYSYLASGMLEAIRAGSGYPAPRASCAQMTLVPTR